MISNLVFRFLLLWTPTHGRAKAGRQARTYIQQLCEDTGCCPEDLPEAMNDREKWRERVRDIRATSTTWWWWWWSMRISDFMVFLRRFWMVKFLLFYSKDFFWLNVIFFNSRICICEYPIGVNHPWRHLVYVNVLRINT